MNSVDIKTRIQIHLNEKMDGSSIDLLSQDDNYDFMESGLLDSFSFLDMLSAIEEDFSIEIPFMDLDPNRFTKLGGLVELISKLIK